MLLGAHLLEALETFRAGEGIFSSAVSKNGEVYAPETSCMKRTSVHIRIHEQNSSVIIRFEILLWLYRPKKFLGLLRNRPQDKFRISPEWGMGSWYLWNADSVGCACTQNVAI